MGEKLSPSDISADLGVPLGTVYVWWSRGTGPDRIKVGRHVRVTREAYERWLKERTVVGGLPWAGNE